MTMKSSQRMLWIDWMKVWAALAVVWGHFFAQGDVFVFVFNLQAFCVISGFLHKNSPDWKTCIKKAFWQLFVPTVILSLIMHLEAYFRCWALGESYPVSWPWFFEWLLLGHRWCMGPCWYFYSLIVIRIVMQALPEKRWVQALLFAACAIAAIWLNRKGVDVSNSNVNALLCMPFFLIGLWLKPLKAYFIGLHNYALEALLFLIGVVGVFLCGYFNGYVWMYLAQYGNSYALYILGGMSGTLMLYIVSLWLSRLPYHQMMSTLANGTMLIIGLHIIIVRRLTELPNRLWGEDLLAAVLIMLMFVPLVRLAELFFPVLLGKKKG